MSELNAMLQLCLKVRLELDPHACPEFDVIEEAALKYAQGRDMLAAEVERRAQVFACNPDERGPNEMWEDMYPRGHSLNADLWDVYREGK